MKHKNLHVILISVVIIMFIFVYFNINPYISDMKFVQLSVLGDLIDSNSIPPDSLLSIGMYCVTDGNLVKGQCIIGGESIEMCLNTDNVQIKCSDAEHVFNESYLSNLKQKISLQPITMQSLTRITSADGSVVENIIVPKDLFSFIVKDDGKNTQLEGGTFQYWLRLKSTGQDIPLLATGTVMINVGDKSEKINVTAYGKTDSDGVVVLRLDTPSGTFLKKINDLISVQGSHAMTVTVLDFNVISGNNTFDLQKPLQIYSTLFTRDDNRVLVQSEKGESVVVSPKDDKLVIQSIFMTTDETSTCYRILNCRSTDIHYVTKFHPAPALDPIKIFRNNELIHTVPSIDGSITPNFSFVRDEEGKTLIQSRQSWETVTIPINAFDGFISRDATYRVEIGSEVITFDAPLSQKNFVISCFETSQVYNLVNYSTKVYELDQQLVDKKLKCVSNEDIWISYYGWKLVGT